MNIFRRKNASQGYEELPPAPPPRGAVKHIPTDQFHSPAARQHTRQQVDMLVASKGYNDYSRHRLRFENTTYLTAFGLLGLFAIAYADFIAMIASNKVPTAEAVGTLLLVSPHWLAVTLSWLATLVIFPCAFMTTWSSLFFELDDWKDVKGVLFFQSLGAGMTALLPFYHFGAVHQPATSLESFLWNFAAISVPTVVGWVYYLWRSQHWQRAICFTSIPLWAVPVIFGTTVYICYDLVHSGRNATVLNPKALISVLIAPNMATMKHVWAFWELHSWTSLVFSFFWYMFPKFV